MFNIIAKRGKMIEVSIIVPVYNVEKYIRRCIESILSQTFTNFELILVNDGSTDRCGEICEEYAINDSRIKVIHKVNGGLSSARNAGLLVAQGSYISFVDSDDYVSCFYLANLMRAFKNESCDISICGMGKQLNDSDCTITYFTNVEACNYIYSYIRKNMSYVSSCAKLYRRHLFATEQFPLGKIHEDQFLTYRLIYKSRLVGEISAVDYYYETNDESITNSHFTIKRYDDLDALMEAIQFYTSNKEYALANSARRRFEINKADYYLKACKTGVEKEIPRNYSISFPESFEIFVKYYGINYAEWYIGQSFPKKTAIYMKLRFLNRRKGKNIYE